MTIPAHGGLAGGVEGNAGAAEVSGADEMLLLIDYSRIIIRV
jgi:hypothetical protein